MMRRTLFSAAAAVAALAAGCSDSGSGPGDDGTGPEQFTATLNVDQIVGADVVSDGTGVASLTFDGEVLSYTIDVTGMTGVTMAHIHGPATPAQNAAIRLWLFSPAAPTGPVNGRLVGGSVTAAGPGFEGTTTLDEVMGLMRSGSAYVLVHTSAYPDGEIRGHVVR